MRVFHSLSILAVGVFLLSGLISCKEKTTEPPDPSDNHEIGKAHFWRTSGDKSALLKDGGEISIKDSLTTSFPMIVIDTSEIYQEIEGFGAALTGSSAYLFNRAMTATQRTAALKDLFDPETGIGISYLRLTMGASDFSLGDFSYDDMPAGQTDFDLEQFSLAQDLQDVVPVLKEIIAINPEIKLMGSPWSAPAWMKTNQSMVGGKLKTECYSVYADYFVKYIQAMKTEGITIDAVTPQNEPLYFTASYPCMEMQAEDQKIFIRDHLGPKFAAAGLNTKIIIYDHNWDVTDYAISILDDAIARDYVAGSAFHAYAGNVWAMSIVQSAHPDKSLYFTEISGGAWATDFSANLMWYMENIFIGTTNNYSKVALLWNLALNLNAGPQNNGCSNCRGVVTVTEANGFVTKNEEYYAIAHMSKFVRPQAVRVSTTVPQSLFNVSVVSFQNADGSKVMVVCNDNDDTKSFSVRQGTRLFSYACPAKSVVSIIW